MSRDLRIAIGQHSDKGRKTVNQDFHGILIPDGALLRSKGIAVALADGISSSAVSQIASESAVKSFLTDYYCTSESWSVKTSVQRVLDATNSWLHSQTRRSQYRYDADRGYVCTLSAMVIKGMTLHIFHVGDGRIYRVTGRALEQLTNDHRIVMTSDQSYLARALGVTPHLEIDYRSVPIETGDVFVLATDGVYEHVEDAWIAAAIRDHAHDLDRAAQGIVAEAYERGSPDNLTVQIVRIESLPDAESPDPAGAKPDLPLPPVLDARMEFDGYRILRPLHGSNRSHIYLAQDQESGAVVVLKTPSVDLGGDDTYLKRFQMEEWIARRIANAHVLRPCERKAKRNYLYLVSEFIEGQTLAQWMTDTPRPGLEAVRGLVEQIARGLQAFHRQEMIHQDLRPENIMIDRAGTVKIIDFGSVHVAGVEETDGAAILGSIQYTAPEYFLGEGGSPCSDIFSLGVIAYQMLTGRLPYGADVPKARTRSAQRKLQYRPALDDDREIPAWVDTVLRKAVHPDPSKRYRELSEFTFDLRHPSPEILAGGTVPLFDRNPVLFWKALSAVLAVVILLLLAHGTAPVVRSIPPASTDSPHPAR